MEISWVLEYSLHGIPPMPLLRPHYTPTSETGEITSVPYVSLQEMFYFYFSVTFMLSLLLVKNA